MYLPINPSLLPSPDDDRCCWPAAAPWCDDGTTATAEHPDYRCCLAPPAADSMLRAGSWTPADCDTEAGWSDRNSELAAWWLDRRCCRAASGVVFVWISCRRLSRWCRSRTRWRSARSGDRIGWFCAADWWTKSRCEETYCMKLGLTIKQSIQK